MKVKLKRDSANFIERTGTSMVTNGNEYFYIPFWFKKTDVFGMYEEYSLEDMPQELKDAITFFQDAKNEGSMMSFPITKKETEQP